MTTLNEETVTINGVIYAIDSEEIKLYEGEYYLAEDIITLADGSDCHIDNARYVGSEGEYYHEDDDDIIYIDSKDEFYHIDNNMIVYCECEGVYEHKHYATRHNGEWYTDHYFNDNFFACDECGDTYHNDDYHSDGICNNCYENSESNHVKDYNTCVISHRGIGQNARIGVELEVECENKKESADALAELAEYNSFILKHDGSLDNGFEIVTRPESFDNTKSILGSVCESLKDTGASSFNTSTCGFHIHVGIRENKLSDLTIGKLLVFMQSVNNVDFLQTIAQRNSDRWASTGCNLKITDKPDSRYTALNLNNSDTIEFRIFKGTLKHETLCLYIDFVELLVNFAKKSSITECESKQAFCKFLLLPENKKQSKSLVEKLRLKNQFFA